MINTREAEWCACSSPQAPVRASCWVKEAYAFKADRLKIYLCTLL
jgi:hypothetical protein